MVLVARHHQSTTTTTTYGLARLVTDGLGRGSELPADEPNDLRAVGLAPPKQLALEKTKFDFFHRAKQHCRAR